MLLTDSPRTKLSGSDGVVQRLLYPTDLRPNDRREAWRTDSGVPSNV